ncbi:MAG TPA: class I SAM-dependent methyltransferase [Dongiaceae bacterium]|nr:class I SAM-dependent methyltransferase [Dongiaceae bacterium]
MTDPNDFYRGGIAVRTYDLFVTTAATAGDTQFYCECARRFGGDVLELGVGTARVAIALAEAGYKVTGLDLSPAMLDLARQKVAGLAIAQRLAFVQGDMSAFDLGRTFSLILVPFRAFQHLLEPDAQRRALDCMRRHLAPGGHLVIDLFDPRLEFCLPEAPPLEGPREVRDPATGQRIRRTIVARDNDPLRQLVSERLRLELLDDEGAVAATEETSWALRWTLRQEMAWLLELCGFEPVEQWSDFHGAAPAYGKEQVWVARAV